MDFSVSGSINWRLYWVTDPFVWCSVFQVDHMPSANWPLISAFLRWGTFAVEMSGRKLRYSPRLCMLTLSSRERNVWMVDNYQRTNVNYTQFPDKMTIHFSLFTTPIVAPVLQEHLSRLLLKISVLCSDIVSYGVNVHHTHSRAISCRWLFSQWSVPADGRAGLFKMRIWLQWPFVQKSCIRVLLVLLFCHRVTTSSFQLLISKIADTHLKWINKHLNAAGHLSDSFFSVVLNKHTFPALSTQFCNERMYILTGVKQFPVNNRNSQSGDHKVTKIWLPLSV